MIRYLLLLISDRVVCTQTFPWSLVLIALTLCDRHYSSLYLYMIDDTVLRLQNNEIAFGSIVQLHHEPTNYLVCGSSAKLETWNEVALSNAEKKLDNCIFLGRNPWHDDELCSKWQVVSRFKNRHDGEPVRTDDYIVLKNLRYRDQILCPYGRIVDIPESSPLSTMVVGHTLTSDQMRHPWFWRIQLLRRQSTKPKALQYGDVVTVASVDSPRKHLVGRLNDDKECRSKIAANGLACLKYLDSSFVPYSYDIFIRDCPEDSVGTGESIAQELWQILPSEDECFPLCEVKMNTPLLLRHVLSGKLLSFTKPSSVSVRSSDIHAYLTNEYSTECLFYLRSVDVDINDMDVIVQVIQDVYFEHKDTETLIILDESILQADKLYSEAKKSKKPLSRRDSVQVIDFGEKAMRSDDEDEIWWEYMNDRPLTSETLDLDSSAVYAAIARLAIVDNSLVNEVMFLQRLQHVTMKILRKIRNPKLFETDMPLFRHFFNVIVSLTRWLLCEVNDDATLSLCIAPSLQLNPPKWIHHSSLIHWVYSGPQLQILSSSKSSSKGNIFMDSFLSPFPYQKCSFSEKLNHPEYNSGSIDIMRRKQLICDCRMIDMMLYFVQSIHLMGQAFDQKIFQEEYGLVELERCDVLPHLLDDCCVAIYDLLAVATSDNPALVSRMLSLSGNFIDLLYQKINGTWDPNIRTLLIAIEPLLQISPSKLTPQQTRLVRLMNLAVSQSDIQNIVSYMYSLRAAGDLRAFQILHILTILCFPGKYTNRQFQEQILLSIASYDSLSFDSLAERGSLEYDCPSNPLFMSKYTKKESRATTNPSNEPMSPTSDQTMPSNPNKPEKYVWEVVVNPEYDPSLLGRSNGAHGSISSPNQSNSYTSGELDGRIQQELTFLATYFRDYENQSLSLAQADNRVNSMGFPPLQVNKSIAKSFLEAQGYGLLYLDIELNHIDGSDFWQLWRWWYARRCHYFPYQQGKIPSMIETKDFLQKNFNDLILSSDHSIMDNLVASSSMTYSQHRDIGVFSAISPLFGDSVRSLPSMASPGANPASSTAKASPPTAIHQDICAKGQTISWSRALSEKSSSSSIKEYDRKWLLDALRVMIALCQDRYFHAQIFASTIMPIECLMLLLETEEFSFEIKKILYDYLVNVYLANDMVYYLQFYINLSDIKSSSSMILSSQSLPSGKSLPSTSSKRSKGEGLTMNQFYSTGMLFNARSRYKFQSSLPERELCQRLWYILVPAIYTLNLSSISDLKECFLYRSYALSMLRAIHSLIHNDFFSERFILYLFPVEEDLKNAIEQTNVTCSDFGMEKLFFRSLDRRFDDRDIQRVLVSKLAMFYQNIIIEPYQSDMNLFSNPSGKESAASDRFNHQKSVAIHKKTWYDIISEYSPITFQNQSNQHGQSFIINSNANVSDEQVKLYYDRVFRDDLLIPLVTETIQILQIIQNQQFSDYIHAIVPNMILKSNQKKDVSKSQPNRHVTISLSKYRSILRSKKLFHDPEYVKTMNMILIHCFLFQENYLLQTSVIHMMNSLALIESNLEETMTTILHRIAILQVQMDDIKPSTADRPQENAIHESSMPGMNSSLIPSSHRDPKGEYSQINPSSVPAASSYSKIVLSDSQILIGTCNQTLAKFASHYALALMTSQTSSMSLKIHIDMVRSCLRFLIKAFTVERFELNDKPHSILSDGSRPSMGDSLSLVSRLKSNKAAHRSSFGIELTSIDVNDHPYKSQGIPQYSMEYEITFMRKRNDSYPLRITSSIVDEIYKSIRIIDRAMRVALTRSRGMARPVKRRDKTVNKIQNNKPFDFSNDRVSSIDLNDEMIDPNEEVAEMDYLADPSIDEDDPMPSMSMEQQNLIDSMQLFENFCELLILLGGYSEYIAIQHSQRVSYTIGAYLSNILSMSPHTMKIFYHPEIVMELLQVYMASMTMEESLQDILFQYIDETVSNLLSRYKSILRDSNQENDTKPMHLPDLFEIQQEVAVFELLSSILMVSSDSRLSEKTVYSRLIGMIESWLDDLYDIVIPNIVILNSSIEVIQLGYVSLYGSIVKFVRLLAMNVDYHQEKNQINHIRSLSICLSSSICNQVLSSDSLFLPLAIKSQLCGVSAMLYDYDKCPMEKYILWELDSIYRYLSSDMSHDVAAADEGDKSNHKPWKGALSNEFMDLLLPKDSTGDEIHPHHDIIPSLSDRCLYSCREYLMEGVLPAMIWRGMSCQQYNHKAVSKIMFQLVKSRLEGQTAMGTDLNAIEASIQSYLSLKASQMCYPSTNGDEMGHNDENEGTLPFKRCDAVSMDYYHCLRLFMRIIFEYRRHLRLFDCSHVIIHDLKDILMQIGHLFCISKHFLVIASNGYADSLWQELQIIEESILFDELGQILQMDANSIDSHGLSQPLCIQIEIVDKKASKQSLTVSNKPEQSKDLAMEGNDDSDEDEAKEVDQSLSNQSNDGKSNRFVISRTQSEMLSYRPMKETIDVMEEEDQEKVMTSRSYHKSLNILLKANDHPSKTHQSNDFASSSMPTIHLFDYLKKSSLFEVIGDKIRAATRYQVNQSKATSLKDLIRLKGSPYDQWNDCGGKMVLNLIHFLIQLADNHELSTETLIQLFIYYLDDNIDEIRSNMTLTLLQRNQAVQKEITRIHNLQDILVKCDIISLIMDKIIHQESYQNNALKPSNMTQSIQDIYHESSSPSNDSNGLIGSHRSNERLHIKAFQLGAAIAAYGNRNTQDVLMKVLYTIPKAIPLSKQANNQKKRMIPGMVALFELILSIQSQLESIVDPSMEEDIQKLHQILPTITIIFQFCSSLCAGFYEKGKSFLVGKGMITNSDINILTALIDLLKGLIQISMNLIHYISSEVFLNQLAPFVMISRSTNRRLFLNWHHPKNNYPLLLQLISTIGKAFDSIIRMHGKYSHDILLIIVASCPALLQFLGLLNLNVSMPSTAINRSILSSLFSSPNIVWNGGDPYAFYPVYYKEMLAQDALETLPDKKIIQKLGSLSKKESKIYTMRRLFGIELKDFHRECLTCELQILRFLIAMMESTNDNIKAKEMIMNYFDIEILFQNLDSYYSQGKRNDQYIYIAVQYITFISGLGSINDDINGVFNDWLQSKSGGELHKSQIASVEVNGTNNSLQRIYFVIPKFVRKFWGYPGKTRG